MVSVLGPADAKFLNHPYLSPAMSHLVELANQLADHDFDDIPIMSVYVSIGKSPAKAAFISDLSEGSSSVEARQRVASEIRHACLTAGFFFGKTDYDEIADRQLTVSRCSPGAWLVETNH